MKKSIILLLLISCIAPCISFAIVSDQDLPEIEAVRAKETITVDGLLDEAVWQREGYSRLIQRDPIEGAEPTEHTSVLIAYNDEGLYIAGMCFHSGPDSIVGGLARRDENVESDWFWFWIDPNYDRQNGFGFAVNPEGSIIDQRLYRDIMTDDDWDGVWEAAAVRHSDRWTFEIFIPFDQLRFDKADEYLWGVNFKRYILANAEHDYFAMVPKDELGFVSRFGALNGLRGVEPPPRLFVSPYASGQLNDYPGTTGSPFYSDMRYGRNMGLDIKYGLTGNLTLDLALNPDFGQAEVDPAVINLSAFETFYSEKRAFFLEGSDIFRFGANPAGGVWGCYWSDPSLFYSRRIGRQPAGSPVHEGDAYTPEQTTILGAAKVSGKIKNWSLGSVNAVTQREYALVDSDGIRFEDEIEPTTFYGIYRGMGEFNDGKQGLGFIITHANRDQDLPSLTSINNTRAIVVGADGWTFIGKNRNWAFIGKGAYSWVNGTRDRIGRLQQSSRHYYQRPDFESESLDTSRTLLDGYMGRFGLRTVGGNAHFQTALGIISPGFNVNDLGYNSYGNLINMHVVVGYRWLEPTSWYRRINLFGMTSRNFDFDGNRLFSQYYAAGYIQLLNYLSINSSLQLTPDGLDIFGTRGGPILAYPGYTVVSLNTNTDSRKTVQLSGNFYGQFASDRSYYQQYTLSCVVRPSSSFKITLSAGYTRILDHQQWVSNEADSAAAYGYHFVFSDIGQKRVSTTLRVDWGITPQLSLQAYFEPFFAVGDYSGFKELARARSYDFDPYYFDSFDPDFNFKSLKGNLVLRWEYLPGSLLYLVWTQNRVNTEWPGEFNLGRDVRALTNEAGDNIFFIKVSHMFSVL